MNLVCADLATKAELQELKDQINALLGQPEQPGGQPINVLSQGSLAGTAVASFLLADMEIVDDVATKTTKIFRVLADGTKRVVGGATAGMSKVANTGKAAAATTGALLSSNAVLIADVANLGIGLVNILTINALSDRLDTAEKRLLIEQQYSGDVYASLIKANDNIATAKENIETLEADLQEIASTNQELSSSIQEQNLSIETLKEGLETSEENNNVLKQNLATVQANLEAYQEYTTEEITVLNQNVQTLQTNLETEQENREKILSVTEKLGEKTAKLEGDITEQSITIEQILIGQSVARAELILLEADLNEQVDLVEASVTSLGARLRVAEDEIRRKGAGGGGVPVTVQESIANQQNGLVNLAATLLGNPATVTDPATNAEVPVTANDTYENIFLGTGTFSTVFPGLIASLPNLTNLQAGDGVNIDELTQSQAQLKEDLKVDFETIMTTVIAASIVPQLNNLSNATSPAAISSATKTAICESTTAPDGCLKTNVTDPLKNQLNGLGDGVNGILNGLNLLQGDAILSTVTETRNFLGKAWGSTVVQNTLTATNTVLAFHNAWMLSRNLTATVNEATNLVLNALPIPAFDDSEINVGQWINNKVTSIVSGAIGSDNYTALTTALTSTNRILVAGQGIVGSIHGVKSALQEGQEIIANRVGTLGNTFLEQGIFEDNSYPWMSTNTNFRNPFARFNTKVQNLTELTEEINGLVSSGIEVQENVNQLFDQNTELLTASQELQAALDQFELDKTTEDTTQETESQSPDIIDADLVKDETT